MAEKPTDTSSQAETKDPGSGAEIADTSSPDVPQAGAEDVNAEQAMPDSEPQADAAQNSPPPRRGGVIGVVIGTVVAVILIIGSAVGTWPYWSPMLAALIPPPQADSGVTDRLDVLEERLGDAQRTSAETAAQASEYEQTVAAELAALQAARQALVTELDRAAARLSDLEVSLKSLQETAANGGVADQGAGPGALEARLAALEQAGASTDQLRQELDSLTAGMEQEESRDAVIATLSQRNEDLANSVAALTGRMSDVEKARLRGSGAGGAGPELLVAIAGLRRVLVTSQPFDAALDAVMQAADGDAGVGQTVAPLQPLAATGIPTRDQIRSRFDTVAKAMLNADATTAGDGWIDQTASRLKGLITVRRVGAGPSRTNIDNAIAHAESALAAGELVVAVASLEKLSEPAINAAAEWLADARARLAAEQTLADLDLRAAGATVGTSRGN